MRCFSRLLIGLTRISSLCILPATSTSIDAIQMHRISSCFDCIFAWFHWRNVTLRKHKITTHPKRPMFARRYASRNWAWTRGTWTVINETNELNCAQFFKCLLAFIVFIVATLSNSRAVQRLQKILISLKIYLERWTS